MKFQEVFVSKCLNFRIFQSPLGFSIDHNDHIMKLVNEWSPTENFIKFDTHFSTDSRYEKELMETLI